MLSTPEQFRNFLQGPVWKDMSEELDIWIDDVRGALEDPDGTIDPNTLGGLRGIIRACNNFKAMPEILMENLMDDIEHSNKEKKQWRE